MNITIYTNETCPYCKAVKEELEKQDIKFLNRLTSEYTDDWNDIVSLTGMPNVPTIVHKDEIYVPGRDFQNPQALVKKIKLYVPPKYNDLKKAIEKIKTLNYSISVAFSRMDQLLKQIETKIK